MILIIKKRSFLLLFQCLIYQNMYCQIVPLPIREQFDELKDLPNNNLDLYEFINGIEAGTNIPQLNSDDVLDYDATLGDRFSDVWSAYLTMFKTTGDKAYLNHFISQTYFCQQFRNDLQSPAFHPGWWQIGRIYDYDSEGNSLAYDAQEYWDGKIIFPMAEYCFKIIKDPAFLAIKDEPMPTIAALDITDLNKWPSPTIITYGDYATWLAARVHETLQWYLNEGSFNDAVGIVHKYTGFSVLQINQQAPFGAALFYLGAYYNNATYLNKSKIIANRYKGNVQVSYQDGSFLGFPLCVYPLYSVFQLYNDLSRNAYVWYTNGWESHRLPGETECDFGPGYWEDIGHGALTVAFPLAIYEYQNEYWGTNIFLRAIYSGLQIHLPNCYIPKLAAFPIFIIR
jgi:hypothetical protein